MRCVRPDIEDTAATNYLGIVTHTQAGATLERLLRVVDGNTEVLQLLIDSFLEDAPGLVDQMQQAVSEHDSETLRRAAHTLKSNCADFGAVEMSAQCKEVEAKAKEDDWTDMEPLVAEIVTSYDAVAQALLELAERNRR